MLAAAAPFFLSAGALLPAAAHAQPSEILVFTGAASSGALVRDGVATPGLRQLLGGGVQREVVVTPATGPLAGAGWRVGVGGRVAVEVEGLWSPAPLRVDEDGSEREMQRVHVVQALLGTAVLPRAGLEIGAAAGVLAYLTDRQGMFEEGSGALPALRGYVALRLPVRGGRLALRGAAQVHRFGTPALRRVGGTDGTVARYEVSLRIRALEVGG